jgi:hypothetical protein
VSWHTHQQHPKHQQQQQQQHNQSQQQLDKLSQPDPTLQQQQQPSPPPPVPPQQQQHELRLCTVGPVSVGSALTISSVVCGGHTLTASDVAVLLHDRLPGLISRAGVPEALLAGARNQQELQGAWQVGWGGCLRVAGYCQTGRFACGVMCGHHTWSPRWWGGVQIVTC